jgi:hypothetical protein
MSEAPHRSEVLLMDPHTGKYAWECPQRGCFSGYRFKTAGGAQAAGKRHDKEANARDERIRKQLFGGRQ